MLKWLRIVVQANPNKSGSKFELPPSHPFEVYVSRMTMAEFTGTEKMKSDVVLLSLRSSFDRMKTKNVHKMLDFRAEILVRARCLENTFLEPVEPDSWLLVSSAFAYMYDFYCMDFCLARRVNPESVFLESVSLLPLVSMTAEIESYVKKMLVEEGGYVVSQRGLLLIPELEHHKEGILNVAVEAGPTKSKKNSLSSAFWGFYVIDSYPFFRGLLGVNTSIYLLHDLQEYKIDSKILRTYHADYGTLYTFKHANYFKSTFSSPSPTRRPIRGPSILFPNVTPPIDSKFNHLHEKSLANVDSLDLEIITAPFVGLQPEPRIDDLGKAIGICIETLRKFNGIFSGSWVCITHCLGDCKYAQVTHVYCLTNKVTSGFTRTEWKRNTIYASSLMAFNLRALTHKGTFQIHSLDEKITSIISQNLCYNTNFIKYNESPIESKREFRELENDFAHDDSPVSDNRIEGLLGGVGEGGSDPNILIGTHVAVSQVSGTGAESKNNRVAIKEALISFFSEPQVLRCGELLGVVIRKNKFLIDVEDVDIGDEEAEEKLDGFQDDFNFSWKGSQWSPYTLEVCYFRFVNGRFNSWSLVGSKFGLELLRHSSCQSYVPPFYSEFITQPPYGFDEEYRWKPFSSLPGLESVCKTLEDIFKPCFYPESAIMGLKVRTLLCGSSGSGKTTLLSYLASKLGLNLIIKNCYDFIASSNEQTENNLKNFFSKIPNQVPLILCLDNVDAFDKCNPEPEIYPEPTIAKSLDQYLSQLEFDVIELNGLYTHADDCKIPQHPSDGDERTNSNFFSYEQFFAPNTENIELKSRNLLDSSTTNCWCDDGFELDWGIGSGFLHDTWSSVCYYPIFIVATCQQVDSLSRTVRACFSNELQLKAPDDGERFRQLESLLDRCSHSLDISMAELVHQTVSFSRKDFFCLIFLGFVQVMDRTLFPIVKCDGHGSSTRKKKKNFQYEFDVCDGRVFIDRSDLEVALGVLRSCRANMIGTPRIPQIRWDDIGGLGSVKRDIMDMVQLPLNHPELFLDGLEKRSGILLYGPPGTGKTMLAKAVASECNLNFISVKGPELISMYVGESEKNIRQIFDRAREVQPCIVFFDEVDSLAPARGRSSDSGGVMGRLVSQFLVELSGIGCSERIFVIGATNRPDLVDPSLLIPGRFDKLVFLGVEGVDQKYKILMAQTKKFNLDADVDLKALAEMCPTSFTGADLYALCSDALFSVIREQVGKIDEKSIEKFRLGMEKPPVLLVGQGHFLGALRDLKPSIAPDQLEKYTHIKNLFR